jgi:hypothetical protein
MKKPGERAAGMKKHVGKLKETSLSPVMFFICFVSLGLVVMYFIEEISDIDIKGVHRGEVVTVIDFMTKLLNGKIVEILIT